MGKKHLKVHQVKFAEDDTMNYRWYTAKTNFNYERKAQESILARAASMGFENAILEVIVPIIDREVEVVNKKGEKKTKIKSEKIFGYDGYVWVKMIMNNDTWNVVRNSNGIIGWCEAQGRPLALTESEILNVKTVCGLIEQEREQVTSNFDGKVGDAVEIVEGAMSGARGKILSIDQEKKVVKVEAENGFMKFEAQFYQLRTV